MVKIIKNGRVIDPESRFDGRADLWIENGKIQKIVKKDTKAESDGASDAPSIPADAEVLDAEGLIVAPRLFISHTVLFSPCLLDRGCFTFIIGGVAGNYAKIEGYIHGRKKM